MTRKSSIHLNDSGIALLLAVFVIVFATIIVMGLSYQSRFDARASRAFAESIKADYILKSGVTIAQTLIELPKGLDRENKSISGDWLGDIWARLSSFENLNNILSGVGGEVRIEIVDEDGKIDLNSLVGLTSQPFSQSGSQRQQQQTPTLSAPEFWIDCLSKIFLALGFHPESSDEDRFRTPGGNLLDPYTQAAVIHDWIDQDRVSFSSPNFAGQGLESSLNRTLFFNRPLNTLSEVLMVPGMTLDRHIKIAPFVTVGTPSKASSKKININTAPPLVLEAMGIRGGDLGELTSQRMLQPLDQEILNYLTAHDTNLRDKFKFISSHFSVFIRVKFGNAVRWAKAEITASGTPPSRKTEVRYVEFH